MCNFVFEIKIYVEGINVIFVEVCGFIVVDIFEEVQFVLFCLQGFYDFCNGIFEGIFGYQ